LRLSELPKECSADRSYRLPTEAAYYHVSPPQDPTGPTRGDTRVLRGGRVAQPVVAARHVWAIRLQWVTQTPGFAC
ncbi:MAG: hypothetical protein MK364_18170, partial [Pirellulales bacterium]|nr:hypothetical protein [Pirellulales bacterium]